jgi:DNA-binding CsgD family transcriptional regulator
MPWGRNRGRRRRSSPGHFALRLRRRSSPAFIARGTSPYSAARELNISKETARNQLKAVFAKTGTHRQSELVALLLQVE